MAELWPPSEGAGVPATEVVAAPLDAARLGRLQQQIEQCLVELRRSRADAVTVVIKPDAATELSVIVHLHQGQIEVDAQCRRGDCAAWLAHWAQLQQTLAPQGVRLGGLQDFTQPSVPDSSLITGGFHHSSDPDSPPWQSPAQPTERAPIKLKDHRPSPPQPVRLTARGARHWESWA